MIDLKFRLNVQFIFIFSKICPSVVLQEFSSSYDCFCFLYNIIQESYIQRRFRSRVLLGKSAGPFI